MGRIPRAVSRELNRSRAADRLPAKEKPIFTRRALASAVALALAGLTAPPAMALPGSCPSTVSTAIGPVALTGGCNVTVTSTGSIVGNNTTRAVTVSGVTAGSITNSGTVSGASGIYLTNSGTLGSITNNAGATISGTGLVPGGSVAGIGIYARSHITGDITNSGTISAATFGIAVIGTSTIGGSIVNKAGGIISGDGNTGAGIFIYAGSTVSSIANSGTIRGTKSGASGIGIANSAITNAITNNAGGVISGVHDGIDLYANGSVGGGISNSGTISGNSGNGIIIQGGSTVNSGISNSGTISGGIDGINVDNGAVINNGIQNSGTISGAVGIGLSHTASIAGGVTNNASGTISGTQTGIDITNSSSIVAGLNNSGTISGGQYAVFVDGKSTLDAINISGANTAQFKGDVVAPNTPVELMGGATFTATNAFDVQSFKIDSGATFNMGAMPSTSGGTAGLTASNGVTNAGTLAVPAGANVTITGNYTQTATGVFETGVASKSSFGKLNVTGTADLTADNKLAVNVTNAPTLARGDKFAGVLTAGTLKAGALTVTDNSALFNFTATVNGNAIDLTIGQGITASSAVAATGRRSAIGAAAVLDSLVDGSATGSADMGTVITALGKLSTDAQLSDAVGQTLPLLDGSMARTALFNLRGIDRVIEERQNTNLGLSSGDNFLTHGNAWIKPLGAWADQGNNNGAYGYSAQTYGVMAGADAGLYDEASRIGAAFAYSHSNVDSNSNVQSANVDSYLGVLYGSHRLNANTVLHLQADYGYNQNNSSRFMPFVSRTAAADYGSYSYHVGAAVDHTLSLGADTTLTPSLSADYTNIHSDSYTESGAGALNLSVRSQTVDQLILAARGRLAHRLSNGIVLSGNLGLGYDPLAERTSITSAFQGGGAAFTTTGINPGHVLILGGLGLTANLPHMAQLVARYDFELRNAFSGQTASLALRMPFW